MQPAVMPVDPDQLEVSINKCFHVKKIKNRFYYKSEISSVVNTKFGVHKFRSFFQKRLFRSPLIRSEDFGGFQKFGVFLIFDDFSCVFEHFIDFSRSKMYVMLKSN